MNWDEYIIGIAFVVEMFTFGVLIGMTLEQGAWRRSKRRLAPYDPGARLFKFMRPNSAAPTEPTKCPRADKKSARETKLGGRPRKS